MPLTDFPAGVSSFGVPVIGGGGAWPSPVFGPAYFVDGLDGAGASGGDGSRDHPWHTMDAAFDKILARNHSGAVIYFRGNIREQLTTPAGIFDVTIVGCGNRPRHADSHTSNNGYAAATWKQPASATASTPLLTIQQQGWRIYNVLFAAAPAATPTILLYRDGGSGDDERDASHAHIVGCRFSAPVIGIQDSGGCAFVRIQDCMFHGATTAAINNVTGAGIGTLLLWQILDNQFHDNAIGIDLSSSQATILRNVIGKTTTYGIDLDGGSYNGVHSNWLHGSYTTDKAGQKYRSGTNDNWSGNFSSDEDEDTVTSGVTHDVPTTD